MAVNRRDIKALCYIFDQPVTMRNFIMTHLTVLTQYSYGIAKEFMDNKLRQRHITQEEYDCAIGFINAINN